MKKKLISHILIYIITAAACILVLLLVNCIPQSAIQHHAEQSTDYLVDNAGFPVVIKGLGSTRMDNYADSMLLNVTYNVDSTKPFYALVADAYYRIDENEAVDDLTSSVYKGAEPQNNYSRYWHGMQIFLRPLLTVFSITAVRYILAAILLGLNVVLCIMLWKQGCKAIMVLYIISSILVDIWMCAFSLEYISVFLLVAVLCIAVVRNKGQGISHLLVIGGALTCFFDFLTTETLTLTIPVIMYLLMQYKAGEELSWKKLWKRLVLMAGCWIGAYAGMFILKWCLVYAVCGRDAFMLALSSAAYRVSGSVTETSSSLTLSGVQTIDILLLRNLGCLFHIAGNVSRAGIIAAGLISICVYLAFFYMFRKKKYNGQLIGILLVIGAVPYIRYLVLQNHSCLHYFFTYRAQMAAVMAWLGILYISVDIMQYKKKKHRR